MVLVQIDCITTLIQAKGLYKGWHKADLLVIADKGRIVFEDPGKDTPIMVYGIDEIDGSVYTSATLSYAIDSGYLEGRKSERTITTEEQKWLEEIEVEAYNFLGW